MVRLTTASKDSIVEAALAKSGATARQKALDEKRYDWAERVRVEVLGGPEKAAHYAAINAEAAQVCAALPSDLQKYSRLVNVEGRIFVNLAGANLRVSLRNITEAPQRATIAATSPLCQEFHDLEAEGRSIALQTQEVQTHVEGVLSRFGTVKRLLEAWPEAAELLPAEVTTTKAALPALRVEDLNRLVGLSPSDGGTKGDSHDGV